MTDLIRAELQALIDSAENHVSPYRSHENAWDAALNRARAALVAAPPAHDPHESLAARPLLEQVARLGDRIGQHTVGEILVLSDRAAAWLAENPPGQPVAIEPRGCPIPGACACVEPATAPPTDGEAEELAALMEQDAECLEAEQPDLMNLDNHQLRRAAALLRQLPPEGLEVIQYWNRGYGTVIQRVSATPESWAVRSGGSCMSTTGEWEIEPTPSSRTAEWLTTHRWPTAAAAWAALQQHANTTETTND